ncbi:hypothetical protein PYW07_012021 [Mythimna separata]|uniref:Peptidase S1 domain-containing protein n=1 Tax=Mythimna separata TaxID=271217 RepID=A0AAD7YLC5_MYTSE|nr:hypothetical protein PYW07_012021 [Mythimna separata]
MYIKTGLLVITLLVGCFALPTPEHDMSMYFDHTDPDARIVGGTQAAAGSNPHMVAMTTGLLVKGLRCGASLMTQRTVLTAAHCITAVLSGNTLSSSLRVIVGTNRWNSGGTSYTLSRFLNHPQWNPSTIKNDIGLLFTSSNVVLNNNVRTVSITFAQVGGNVATRMAGWGRTSQSGSVSQTLLELRSVTLAPNDCVTRMRQASIQHGIPAPAVNPNLEVCTIQPAGQGVCNGDSGSALRRNDNGQQFGVTSWTLPCGRGAPDVFVRLSAYQTWLRNNVV